MFMALSILLLAHIPRDQMEWLRGWTELSKGIQWNAVKKGTQVKNCFSDRHLDLKINSLGDDWDEHLNHALFDIRIRPHTATKFSPFEMFHTWEMRFDPHETETPEEEAFLDEIDSADKAVEERLGKSSEKW